MLADVEGYVRHRDACQVNKASTKSYADKWQPGGRWERAHHIGLNIEAAKDRQIRQVAGGSEHIILDLTLKLPKIDRGHDSILVFVNRPSKLVICYSHS